MEMHAQNLPTKPHGFDRVGAAKLAFAAAEEARRLGQFEEYERLLGKWRSLLAGGAAAGVSHQGSLKIGSRRGRA